MVRILVVEDDVRYGQRLCKNLTLAGHVASSVESGEAALAFLRRESVDLVLSDVVMPGISGLDLLSRIRNSEADGADPDTPLILLTSVDRVDTAVQAMRAGAQDYITKESSRDAIVLRIERVMDAAGLRRRADALEHALESASPLETIIAESDEMKGVMRDIHEIAEADANVLIVGETGVGKELAARHLHRHGRRGKQAFIDVNCAALPTDNLFQSEVFGHEKGAFTGAVDRKRGKLELADGGVLFLDEIGDMPAESQGKILRALDTQAFERLGGDRKITVDLLVIAATNKDLRAEADAGRFRRDLLFRLDVLHVEVPPLRVRRTDIVPLVRHYLQRSAGRRGRTAPELTPDAADALVRYDWPGNVRELINVVERLLLRHRGEAPLSLDSVRREGVADGPGADLPASTGVVRIPAGGISLEELERQAILEALKRCDWVQSAAARLLKISPDRMNARVKKFGITHPSWRSHTGD